MHRTHKRNRAEETLDINLCMTSNPGRLTMGAEYSGPLTLRLDDCQNT